MSESSLLDGSPLPLLLAPSFSPEFHRPLKDFIGKKDFIGRKKSGLGSTVHENFSKKQNFYQPQPELQQKITQTNLFKPAPLPYVRSVEKPKIDSVRGKKIFSPSPKKTLF